MSALVAAIEDYSQISAARRTARQLAAGAGFDEAAAERAALIVTEAGTNLLKHAGSGRILVTPTENGSIEILILDTGPGISDLATCLYDGYSTAGTAGTGLGAITRLSSFCDVYSQAGRGTALLARLSSNTATTAPADYGAAQVPKPGQEVCGDSFGVASGHGRRTFLVADGLGHGPEAARASRSAVNVLQRHPDLPPGEMMSAVHAALRPTRGAAVAIAEIDDARGTVLFTGLGNISAAVHQPGGSSRSMVSINGTAGMEARHIREFTYPWPAGSLLIMYSDGIGTHWSLADYPALASHDPALIAGVLFRDHGRRTDDATILVAK